MQRELIERAQSMEELRELARELLVEIDDLNRDCQALATENNELTAEINDLCTQQIKGPS